MTNTVKIIAGSVVGAIAIALAMPFARAQPSTGCAKWEISTFSPSEKDPAKRFGLHSLPAGWEPFGGTPIDILVRRCAP